MSDNTTSLQIPFQRESVQQRPSFMPRQSQSGAFSAFTSPRAMRKPSIIVTVPSTGKQIHLHVDSPRTMLAMKQLGIIEQNLIQKSIEDFGGVGATEKVKQMRFDHHMDRLNQDLLTILRKRRDIIIRERDAAELNQQIALKNSNNNQNTSILTYVKPGAQRYKDSSNVSTISTKANTIITGVRSEKIIPFSSVSLAQFGSETAIKSDTNLNITNIMNQPKSTILMKPNSIRSFSESKISPLKMKNALQKTMNYLKQNHDTPDVQVGSIILGSSDDMSESQEQEYDPFENQMEKEIDRYNRLKKQKQQEAKFLYLEDVKKKRMQEELVEREKKMIEFKVKEEKDKKIRKEQNRERAIQKLEQIREYNIEKEEERARQKEEVLKKLENLKQRQLEQDIVNEKTLEEKRRLRRERNEKISRAKSECVLKELKESQSMYRNFVQKQNISDLNYQDKLAEKQQRTRDRLTQEQQRLEEFLEQQKKQQQIQFSSFIERLQEKDDNFKKNMNKKIREEMKAQEIKKEKNDQLKENQSRVFSENQEKKVQLNNKFQKIEENRLQRKEDQIENSKLKQEQHNLKLQYMHENFERQNRINDYKLEKMLEKERWHADNIAAIKNQRDQIQSVQREVYNQYRNEGDRIYDGVKVVSEKLFPSQLSPVKLENAKKGIRVLKKIFKQDETEEQELVDKYLTKKTPQKQTKPISQSQYIIRD